MHRRQITYPFDVATRALDVAPEISGAGAERLGGLWWYVAVLAVLWGVSIASAVARSRFEDGFRWIFFGDPLFDFYNYFWRVDDLHTPAFFSHNGYRWYYPAGSIFPLRFFYGMGKLAGTWVVGYLGYVIVAVGGAFYAALCLARGMARAGSAAAQAWTFVVLSAVLSWPIYFSLQRGNIEAVTWLLLAASVWAYARERWLLAAILLGTVASFKIYPALCFALFLPARRWKELAAGMLTLLAVTILALRYMEPNVADAARGVVDGMTQWTADYAQTYSRVSAAYDHSLYELVKVATVHSHPSDRVLLRGYLFTAALLGLAVYFARVVRLPRTNQVLFLVSASVLLPPASFDYTLENLCVPFGWLVLVYIEMRRGGRRPQTVWVAILLLGLLMGPETFLLWSGVPWAGVFKGGGAAGSPCVVGDLTYGPPPEPGGCGAAE